MILIGDKIIDTLKASAFSAGTITVRPSYTGQAPKCPMLVLDELPTNGPAQGYAGNQPRIVQNIITIESYAKDMMISGKAVTKKSAAMQLLIEADKILNETCGLTMVGTPQVAPYSDSTIFRAVATYTVYIDIQTNILYRRLT